MVFTRGCRRQKADSFSRSTMAKFRLSPLQSNFEFLIKRYIYIYEYIDADVIFPTKCISGALSAVFVTLVHHFLEV